MTLSEKFRYGCAAVLILSAILSAVEGFMTGSTSPLAGALAMVFMAVLFAATALQGPNRPYQLGTNIVMLAITIVLLSLLVSR